MPSLCVASRESRFGCDRIEPCLDRPDHRGQQHFGDIVSALRGTSARAGRFPSMLMKHFLLLSGVMVSASSVAVAQAPPTPATPPAQTAPPAPIRSSDCAPTKPMPQQGTVSPEGSTIGQRTEPLGDKLARSDGVLCPPIGVDPEIRAPTPDRGSNMPVIPPPGSPGGDPSVRPE